MSDSDVSTSRELSDRYFNRAFCLNECALQIKPRIRFALFVLALFSADAILYIYVLQSVRVCNVSFMLYSILYIPRNRCGMGKHGGVWAEEENWGIASVRWLRKCETRWWYGGAWAIGSEIQLWEYANVFVWVIKLHSYIYIYQFTQINIDIAGEIKYYFHDIVFWTPKTKTGKLKRKYFSTIRL